MSDLAAVLMALAAAAGALAARPVPLGWAVLLVAAGLAVRRPAVLCLGVALATSAMAARSWAGLHPPLTGPWSGTVTLAGDPRDVAGALRVDVRLGGKRLEGWARGAAAGALRSRLAGERVWVEGIVSGVPPESRARLARRHVAGRMDVRAVRSPPADHPEGDPLARLANRLRRTILAGAASLPPERRALLSGFVLGDDRGQPPEVVHDFRASGLSHLLVVSGQNVAFVLALAAPAVGRLGLRGRLVAAAAVLALFGTLTRWEPSVLRAVGMAGVALLASALGRPVSALRALALAVSALLLIDPILVGSVGFLLSVAACTGLALLAGPLARAIPGPRPLATVLGATLAAQVGVAPVLIPVFGGLPAVALVANLLAVPAAGPLMVWGLAAGLPAGLVGEPMAGLVHLPTRLLLDWVAAVARWSAALPLGSLAVAHLLALAAAGAALVAARARDRPRLAVLAGAAGTTVLLLPALAVLRPPPATGLALAGGGRLWRAGDATVVVLEGGRGPPDRLLDGLHAAGVRRVDVLVATSGGLAVARAVAAVHRRVPVGLVLAPRPDAVAGATVPQPGSSVDLGLLVVEVGEEAGRLTFAVTVRGGSLAAALPLLPRIRGPTPP